MIEEKTEAKTDVATAIMKRAEESIAKRLEDVPSSGALMVASQLKEALLEQEYVAQYVRQAMKEGIDYGVIPGTDKRKKDRDGNILPGQPDPPMALLKPGAEKLVSLFRCTPTFEIVEKTERYEPPDKAFFRYLWKVTIRRIATGDVLAEGFGESNSLEAKYRWRTQKRKCPQCKEETIGQSSKEFYCWEKKGGCGAKFHLTDKAILEQKLGVIPNDDVCSVANAIMKQGKKRCLVDGALALGRCSDLFGADLEETADEPQQSDDDWASGKPTDATAEELRLAFTEAETLDEIKAIGERCKHLPNVVKNELRELARRRQVEINKAMPPTDPNPPAPQSKA